MLDCDFQYNDTSAKSPASASSMDIRRLKQIRRFVGPDVTVTLVSVFLLIRLDYCNAVVSVSPSLPLHHCSVLRMQRRDSLSASSPHMTISLLHSENSIVYLYNIGSITNCVF